jgi:hypothetical protein
MVVQNKPRLRMDETGYFQSCPKMQCAQQHLLGVPNILSFLSSRSPPFFRHLSGIHLLRCPLLSTTICRLPVRFWATPSQYQWGVHSLYASRAAATVLVPISTVHRGRLRRSYLSRPRTSYVQHFRVVVTPNRCID